MARATLAQKDDKTITRFGLSDRIEHLILMLSFTGLALTGLPQKYAEAGISETMIAVMGGIEMVRIIHRVCAVLLMAGAIIHGGAVTYKLLVLRKPPYLLPSLKDISDMWGTFLHNIGLKKALPKMPRFNFEEKAEYWALVWGTILMIVTGFMLWNPIATSRFLPGQVIPAALAAHGGEALLAVLAIVFYHLYNVIAHGNMSIFTGEIDTELVEEKHGLEYEDIQKGNVPVPPPTDVLKKRLRIFVPVAVIVTVLLIVGVVWFVTFEQTAITTIPPVN